MPFPTPPCTLYYHTFLLIFEVCGEDGVVGSVLLAAGLAAAEELEGKPFFTLTGLEDDAIGGCCCCCCC